MSLFTKSGRWAHDCVHWMAIHVRSLCAKICVGWRDLSSKRRSTYVSPKRAFMLVACLWVGVCALYLNGFFYAFEASLSDWRFELFSRQASGDLVIVEIDAKSIQDLEVWPWPRRLHGTLIENLKGAGANLIGFDVDFSSVGTDDAQFLEVLTKYENQVVLPTFVQSVKSGGQNLIITNYPNKDISEKTILAGVNVFPDALGRVESYQEGSVIDQRIRPSMATVMSGRRKYSSDSFLIDYSIDVSTVPRLRFVDVLHGRFDPEIVEGKNILVGATAIELGDRYAVPRYGILPGVVIQALAAETLLQDKSLVGVSFFFLSAALLAFLLTIFFVCWRRRLTYCILVCAIAFPLVSFVVLLLQDLLGVIAPLSPFYVLLLFIVFVATVVQLKKRTHLYLYERSENQKRRILFDQVVRSSKDGILVTDENGKIETANLTACEMLNLDEADPYSIFDVIPDFKDYFDHQLDLVENLSGHSSNSMKSVERSLSSNVYGDIDVEILGSISTPEIAGAQSALGQGGRAISLTLRNITERKSIEQARINAIDALEKADRAKSEFISNMSHELRTPLNSIIGFSDIIKKQSLGPIGNDEYIGFVREINDSGRHLLSLVNNLLDVSRVELGNLDLRERPTLVGALVQSCVQTVRETTSIDEDRRLEVDVEDKAFVYVDSRLIIKCILNILVNAVNFSNSDDKISVRAYHDVGCGYVFSIKDSGIGIADDEIENVTNVFYQVNTELDRTYEGAGIGLYLASRFMHLHGGKLEIESELGRGTIVRMVLPEARIMPEMVEEGAFAEIALT